MAVIFALQVTIRITLPHSDWFEIPSSFEPKGAPYAFIFVSFYPGRWRTCPPSYESTCGNWQFGRSQKSLRMRTALPPF